MTTTRHLLIVVAPLLIACHAGRVAPTNVAPTQPLAARENIPCDSAVVIRAPNERAGVDAERAWLTEHFPGHSQYSQSLQMGNKRVYDVLTFTTREGHGASICFDITEFYGRW